MKRPLLTFVMVFACGFPSVLSFAEDGQKDTKQKVSSPAPLPSQSLSQAVVIPTYKYEAKGRRDPFRSLDVTNSIQATSAPIVRPPGIKGQLVSEISLVGIVQSKGEYLAMATGYRGKTYFVRSKDELYDGRVMQIRSDAVVFNQVLTDSQGKKLSQQVVKKLYPTRGEGNDTK